MEFQGIKGALKTNYNLAPLTWFKVGGSAELFFKPQDEADLISALKQFNRRSEIVVLGAGSNIIIRDGGIKGLVIKLTRGFMDVRVTDDGFLRVGAGCLNYNLAKFAQNHGISGLEFLVGIPGCIGGGVIMNAGSYGQEFKDIVHSIHVVDFDGNIKNIAAQDIGFSYRSNNLPKDLIVTSVDFKMKKGNPEEILETMNQISEQRKSTQPITEKTGGSTFANPEGHKAWELVDKVGMRGFKIGGASMSQKHCNFMINDGTATASDIETLGDLVRERVYEQEKVELKWEIRRVGLKK